MLCLSQKNYYLIFLFIKLQRKVLFCIAGILLCFSAGKNKVETKEQNFDKNKWAIKQELKYPYRNQMLKDFLASNNT